MSTEKPRVIAGGGSERFGDTPLSFGLHRYTCGTGMSERPPLWRFDVSRYIRSEPLIEVDISLPMLRKMRSFIDSAIVTLETDGGRKDAGSAS